MPEIVVRKSPRLSFKGYKFSEALYRNKDTVKLVLGALTGYGSYLGATGFSWVAFGISIGTALAGLAGKLAFDALDYYFNEVDLVK